jgi:hypothetical protein
MTLYGTKIKSDITFPLDLSHETEVQYEVSLLSPVPEGLKDAITCGFPLYRAHGRKVYLYSDRLFEGNEAGQPWCYEVEGVVSFYWRSGEGVVYYTLHEEGTVALLGFWFAHLLLPLFLTLEGKYDFFHGGSVEIAGKPVMFCAESMGGKSTLTDYFIRQGHVLVSDDKIPTFVKEGRLMLAGAHPYHRPYRKFEDLGYRVTHFTKIFLPLHALYILEKEQADAPVQIEEVTGFEKFNAVISHYLYAFPFLKKRRMVYLARLLNHVRVFRVKRPWDLDRQAEIYAAICSHSRSLS